MDKKYFTIKIINILTYIVLFITIALIPFFLRISAPELVITLIILELIFVGIYSYVIHIKINFINSLINISLKEKFSIYFTFIGIAIMCFSEGYIYRDTDKINFLIVLLSTVTLIPAISLDEKIKKIIL